MVPRTITLVCDEDDWRDIQNEFAKRQAERDQHGQILPDGESNREAAMVAEMARDLREYRDLYKADHP
jgi:hypothetical protein